VPALQHPRQCRVQTTPRGLWRFRYSACSSCSSLRLPKCLTLCQLWTSGRCLFSVLFRLTFGQISMCLPDPRGPQQCLRTIHAISFLIVQTYMLVGNVHTSDFDAFKRLTRTALTASNSWSFLRVPASILLSDLSQTRSVQHPFKDPPTQRPSAGVATTCPTRPHVTTSASPRHSTRRCLPQRLLRSVARLPRQKRLLAEIIAIMFASIQGILPDSLAAELFYYTELPLPEVLGQVSRRAQEV
jgi:hypothetical protein